MLTGSITKWVDGKTRVDGQSFGFIRPDDGSPDVFAPIRTKKAAAGSRNTVTEGDKVEYELKKDDVKSKLMAQSWRLTGDGGRSRSSSSSSSSRLPRRRSRKRSRSRSRKKSRSHSHKKSRSRSSKKSRSRSRKKSKKSRSRSRNKSRSRSRPKQATAEPSKKPAEAAEAEASYKVTVCDLPSEMSCVELEYLAADTGSPVLSAVTYNSGSRVYGIVEFTDKSDADACVLELEGKSMPGSEFKLRCVHGVLATPKRSGQEAEPIRARSPRNKRSPDKRGGKSPMHGSRTSRSRVDERPRRSSRNRHDSSTSRRQEHGHSHQSSRPQGDPHVSAKEWQCNCGEYVVASYAFCPKCGSAKPPAHCSILPGDWECPKCGKNVFASKKKCFACGTPKGSNSGHDSNRDRGGGANDRPRNRGSGYSDSNRVTLRGNDSHRDRGGSGGDSRRDRRGGGDSEIRRVQPHGIGSTEIRAGDWTCPKCGENVFASKEKCFACGEPKGKDVRQHGQTADDIMTLFVPDIPEGAQENQVVEAFDDRGGRKVLRVVFSTKNGLKAAFVRFSTANEAEEALHDVKFRGINIDGEMVATAEMARTNTAAT